MRGAETAGASSRTTCALVPPTPNELTPARRTPSHSHGPYSLRTTKGPSVEVQFGVGAGVVQSSRNRPVFEAENRLDQARDPAADLQVTDVGLDRTEKAWARSGRAVETPNACRRPSISIGSPRGVPVPCVST